MLRRGENNLGTHDKKSTIFQKNAKKCQNGHFCDFFDFFSIFKVFQNFHKNSLKFIFKEIKAKLGSLNSYNGKIFPILSNIFV